MYAWNGDDIVIVANRDDPDLYYVRVRNGFGSSWMRECFGPETDRRYGDGWHSLTGAEVETMRTHIWYQNMNPLTGRRNEIRVYSRQVGKTETLSLTPGG